MKPKDLTEEMVAAKGCILCRRIRRGVIGIFTPNDNGAKFIYFVCDKCAPNCEHELGSEVLARVEKILSQDPNWPSNRRVN